MSFWQPIGVLLALRFAMAKTEFKNNPTAQLGSILMTLTLAVSANGMGRALAHEWRRASPAVAVTSLEGVLMVVAGVLAVGCLMPGMLSMMGGLPPEAILKPFSITRLERLCAELLACLLDIPTVLAILTVQPLCVQLMHANHFAAAIALLTGTLLIALITGLCIRGAAYLGSEVMRRFHRAVEVSLVTTLLFVAVSIAMPPAFAALTNPKVAGANHPNLQSETGPFRTISPMHLASSCVVSARGGDNTDAAESLCMLALEAACLLGAAACISCRPAPLANIGNRSGFGTAGTYKRNIRQMGALRMPGNRLQLCALFVTDLKLMLREPLLFIGLRRPAAIILVGFFALLAPDLGQNPVYSVKEILCLTATIYPFLWQLQLLCNRFGADAGKAALLFGFSLNRHWLIVGKNISLFTMLMVINGGSLASLAAVVGSSHAIGPILLRLPTILILATAVGNVVSVLLPFSIPRSNGKEEDPPNTLLGTYAGIIAGIALLMECMMPITGDAALTHLQSVVLVLGLYTASVLFAARKLMQTERAMIGILDGGR